MNPEKPIRIAVNASSLSRIHAALLSGLALHHPAISFLFIYRDKNRLPGLPDNVASLVVGAPPANPFKWRFWYNFKLPAALKKQGAGVLISENWLSTRSRIPQVLLTPDLSFLHQPELAGKKETAYKKNAPVFFEKAAAIVVTSGYFKNEIVHRFNIAPEKIHVIYPPVEASGEAAIEAREATKAAHAEGNEYFLYKGEIGLEKNLLHLLKAFSFFKKRQRSRMQLILTGTPGAQFDQFRHSLQSYRFKNDVKLLTDISEAEQQELLASAYAMISVPACESEGAQLVEAMALGVPLIVSGIPFMKEYCGEAALYAEADKVNDIAEKMMLLFKDETKRKELIGLGKRQLEKFDHAPHWEKLVELSLQLAERAPLPGNR